MKNKKAIMIKFLVTVLLAIIIFAPACMFASKFFSLSSQAKDNFVDFVNEIKEMEQAQLGERKSSILILDKPTAVVYFEKDQNQVKVDVIADSLSLNYHVIFEKPGQCNADKSCLCLFREFEQGSDLTELRFSVKPTSAICESFDTNIKLNDCGIGVPTRVESYICSNGFTIERSLIIKASGVLGLDGTNYYEAPRRIALTLEKGTNQINLYSNNVVEISGEPFEGEGGSFGGGGAGGTY